VLTVELTGGEELVRWSFREGGISNSDLRDKRNTTFSVEVGDFFTDYFFLVVQIDICCLDTYQLSDVYRLQGVGKWHTKSVSLRQVHDEHSSRKVRLPGIQPFWTRYTLASSFQVLQLVLPQIRSSSKQLVHCDCIDKIVHTH
jgi:hypothetical protein